MLENTPIRLKIAISFIIVAILGFIFLLSYIFFHEKELDLSRYRSNMQETRSLVYRNLQLQNEFLFNEARTNEFHITGTSPSITLLEKNTKQLIDLTTEAHKNELSAEFGLNEALLSFRDLLMERYFKFVSLKNKLLKKGFFNYGLEGEFRLYIHQLEDDYTSIIPVQTVLQLRRIEKDYMLRRDVSYSREHLILTNATLNELDRLNEKSGMAKLLLQNYSSTFQEYVAIDTLIGFDNRQGMLKQMNNNAKNLLSKLTEIIEKNDEMSQIYSRKINLIFLFFGILFLIFFILIIYLMVRNLSRPIIQLSHELNTFISGNFALKTINQQPKRMDEIGDLIRNFYTMQVEIVDHFTKFRLLATEKEKKLVEQKEKIKIQKFLVKASRNELKEQNQTYADSIQYAERIQKSILPKKKKLDDLFGDTGLIYLPKSVVSGDFYWAHEDENYKYAAIVDCTGHGVPGAFMSILGISYLNYGVKDKALSSTADILDYLNAKVTETLGQFGSYSEIKDGMDIVLIRICKQTNTLQYSGAQRELIVQRGKELILLKPDKHPIGWILPGAKKKFNSETIQLEANDLILMYTDGIVDQFGGFAHKKYTRKRLYELLSEEAKGDAFVLGELITTELKNWKRNTEQTDDICLLCFRHQPTEVIEG